MIIFKGNTITYDDLVVELILENNFEQRRLLFGFVNLWKGRHLKSQFALGPWQMTPVYSAL